MAEKWGPQVLASCSCAWLLPLGLSLEADVLASPWLLR